MVEYQDGVEIAPDTFSGIRSVSTASEVEVNTFFDTYLQQIESERETKLKPSANNPCQALYRQDHR